MNFIEFHCIFDDILPKFDRLVLGCINEFLNFFFEFVERVLLFRSFLKKNIKIRKKKERDKFERKSRFFGFSHFETHFFCKISWNFWFFGVTLGKISSRSSQPWRKNKKEKFSAFFWPVEICEILMRLLIVKVNKLVYIITRRNRLGSGWDFNNF